VAHIDYYLFGQSPFTFLGHRALKEMADRHGATIGVKPVKLHDLWANSDAVPTPEQAPVRQRYETIELQRAAHARGVAINLNPRHFPIDIELADRSAIAIIEADGDAFDYIEAVGRGVWCDEADLSLEAEIASRLTATGHDAAAIIARARTDDIEAIRVRNTADAIAADAVGVPAYVLNGEVFFGQDRIAALEQAIIESRAPFMA